MSKCKRVLACARAVSCPEKARAARQDSSLLCGARLESARPAYLAYMHATRAMDRSDQPFEVLDALHQEGPSTARYFCALILIMDVPASHNAQLCQFLRQTYTRSFERMVERGELRECVDRCMAVFEGCFAGAEQAEARGEDLRRVITQYVINRIDEQRKA